MDDKNGNERNSSQLQLKDEHKNTDKSHPSRNALDFTSSAFDPVEALSNYLTAIKFLPCPNVKTFNNLDEYSKKTFKRQEDQPCEVPGAQPRRQFTAEQRAACANRIRSAQPSSTVLTRMENVSGPLDLFHRAKGLRIKLLIRRKKGGPEDSQFSWLSALLIAFDKHFNLILNDVDEVISVHRDRLLSNDSRQQRHRHCHRLFVRGDSVVIVSFK